MFKWKSTAYRSVLGSDKVIPLYVIQWQIVVKWCASFWQRYRRFVTDLVYFTGTDCCHSDNSVFSPHIIYAMHIVLKTLIIFSPIIIKLLCIVYFASLLGSFTVHSYDIVWQWFQFTFLLKRQCNNFATNYYHFFFSQMASELYSRNSNY